jgi:glyoxalase family protein
MVHRIIWRVASAEAIDFWERRLGLAGVETHRVDAALRFADPEGLAHELVVSTVQDVALVGGAPDVPRELALQGFDAVRAYTLEPSRSERLLRDALGFTGGQDGSWEVRGEQRGGLYIYDPAPKSQPRRGAGTVHHLAFASRIDDHEAWRKRLVRAGAHPTQAIDRFYFRSVYFREPSGVLFEIATIGPGFTVDEDAEHLGERLSLPPRFERLRGQLEQTLTPLPNPRARQQVKA